MKILFENFLSIIRKKSPKAFKEMLNNTKDPDKVIVHIKNTRDGSTGHYTINTKIPLLYLDEKSCNNPNCKLSDSLNIKEFTRLLEEGSIKIEDITTI